MNFWQKLLAWYYEQTTKSEPRYPITPEEASAAVEQAHATVQSIMQKAFKKTYPRRNVNIQIIPGRKSKRKDRYYIPVPRSNGTAGAYYDHPLLALAGRADGLYTDGEKSVLRGNLEHEMFHAYLHPDRSHHPALDPYVPGWKEVREQVGS